MILKLAFKGITTLIECGEVRCDHRRFGSTSAARDWAQKTARYSAFGDWPEELTERAAERGEQIHGYHLSIARYKAAHGNENWEQIVAFDCGVFLMNENGKTVEILSQ